MEEFVRRNGDIDCFDEPQPFDRPICSNFGSGAFPCGPPYKVLVKNVSAISHRTSTKRRVMCRMHYEFAVSKITGGAGSFKTRAMAIAQQELAAAHLEEFQAIYERVLTRLAQELIPNIDPALLLPSTQES